MADNLKKTQVPLYTYQGTTDAFGLLITEAETGRPLTLEEGQFLIFGLKELATDDEPVLQKHITNKAGSSYYLELTAEETGKLHLGKYFYSVGLQAGSTVLRHVMDGPFTVLPFGVTLYEPV